MKRLSEFRFMLSAGIVVSFSVGSENFNDSVVAVVFSEKIFASEILPGGNYANTQQAKLDSPEYSKWFQDQRQTVLSSRIWSGLMKKYCRENKINANTEEIQSFNRSLTRQSKVMTVQLKSERDSLERKLSEKSISVQSRNGLKKDLEATNKSISFLMKLDSLKGTLDSSQNRKIDSATVASAEKWVVRFKFNKSLYEKYGGPVIFQQVGLEPIGAYKQLLQESERRGDFKILDSDLKNTFWEYYSMEHHVVSNNKDPFEKPFWEMGNR